MDEPRTISSGITVPRIITSTIEWRPWGDPRLCQCGHQHYPRKEFKNGAPTMLAPQWSWCEDPECRCQGLTGVR